MSTKIPEVFELRICKHRWKPAYILDQIDCWQCLDCNQHVSSEELRVLDREECYDLFGR